VGLRDQIRITSTDTIASGCSSRSLISGHSPVGRLISSITLLARVIALSRFGAVPTCTSSPSVSRITTRRSSDGCQSARWGGCAGCPSAPPASSVVVPGGAAAWLQLCETSIALSLRDPRPSAELFPEGLLGVLDVDRDDRLGADEPVAELGPAVAGGCLIDELEDMLGERHRLLPRRQLGDDDRLGVLAGDHDAPHAEQLARLAPGQPHAGICRGGV